MAKLEVSVETNLIGIRCDNQVAKFWLCFIIVMSVKDCNTQTGPASFCHGGWSYIESCPATNDEPEECIFYDATLIIDTRIISNETCNYDSRELETYNGSLGVYGYSGNTVWIYPGCKATEFEACIGYDIFCSSGLSTTVHCGIDDDPEDVEECVADKGNTIIDVRVIKRLSNEECYYYIGDYTAYTEYIGVYGFSSTIMWVYRGCRAQFEICTVLGKQTSDVILHQPFTSDSTLELSSSASRVTTRRNTRTKIASTDTLNTYSFHTTVPTISASIMPTRASSAKIHLVTTVIIPSILTDVKSASLTQGNSHSATADHMILTPSGSKGSSESQSAVQSANTGYLPSRETDIRSTSTSQGTFHSTVTGNMASIPNDEKSFPSTQTTVHNAETGYKSSMMTDIKSTATSQAAVTGYVSTTPTDVMSFSQPQVTIHRAVTGHMPSTRTEARSSSTTQSTVHSSQTDTMLSTPTAIMGWLSTEATIHSTATGYMTSTPADVISSPTTQATVRIATSTLADGLYFTSQNITGTTIQVVMYTGVTIATVVGAVTGGLAGLAAIAGGGIYVIKYPASCQRRFPDSIGAEPDRSMKKKQEENVNTSQD